MYCKHCGKEIEKVKEIVVVGYYQHYASYLHVEDNNCLSISSNHHRWFCSDSDIDTAELDLLRMRDDQLNKILNNLHL